MNQIRDQQTAQQLKVPFWARLDLHESGPINCYRFFYFFFISSEYLKRLQSSEPLHTKMNLTSCLFGSWSVYNPFFLLAGALLFYEKIRQSIALFLFGLREVGILHS
jgi:hypothetical protein